MASGQTVIDLEKSSDESSTESTNIDSSPATDQHSSTGASIPSTQSSPIRGPAAGVRTFSSPAILELSKDETRHQDVITEPPPLSRNVAGSCPQQLSEATPLLASSRGSSEREETEQSEYEGSEHSEHEERRGQSCWEYCAESCNCCLNNLVEFRRSKYIIIIQVLFSLLPITAVIAGVKYADGCPEYKYLPMFGAVTGLLGFAFVALWIAKTICQQRRRPCHDHQLFTIGFIFTVVTVLVIIDMYFVFHMSPSFDESDPNYCNPAFYNYAVRKEILTIVAYALTTMIFLPKTRHCRCNISRPEPPYRLYHAI